jgi:hypothetical protein
MAPAVYAQTALGLSSAAAGLAAGAFGREPSLRDRQRESAPGALSFNGPSSAYPANRATLHGRVELWRGLSLIDESDDLMLPNDRVTFRLRLR